MRERPTILLTGFGPYPGVSVNPTAEFVPRLAKAARSLIFDHDVVAEVLATEWETAPARLAQLLDQHNVVLALHFGAAREAEGFQLELVCRNQTLALTDAVGRLPKGDRISATGPDLLVSNLPAERIVARLLGLGFPCRTSSNAGTYLCNAILYHSLSAARVRKEGFVSGFIHVPANLVGGGGDGPEPQSACTLNWQRAVSGGLEIIFACLEHIGRSRPPVKTG